MIDFAALKIDALLVSSLANVRYLTGFTGSNALAVITPRGVTLYTDPRYGIQARLESANARMPVKVTVAKRHLQDAVAGQIKRQHIREIGFDPSQLTFATHAALRKALPAKYRLLPTPDVIETLRTVKSEDEIELIRQSVRANSEAFLAVSKQIRPGMRESEIAAELEYNMRLGGAQGPAFETIVASGARTALPHASPTSKALGNHELLLIDMGAARDGYMSDMTRMLFVGTPSRKTRAMYKAVLEAQLAAVAAVADGVPVRRVDLAAREVLKSAGLEKTFIHSTGHGLGLEIHEAPRVSKRDKSRLKAGMVITIEPGAYVEGSGGMRVEDTVLVTKTGCEVLTPMPKELIIL